jgi:DNA topoisomerase I
MTPKTRNRAESTTARVRIRGLSARRFRRIVPSVASEESAAAAGLRYVSETGPGIRRKGAGKGFAYIGLDGKTIRDKKVLNRIRSLVIPPAWTSVWICPDPNGHIQAVGRDAKGRKQYLYHARYRQIRDRVKFNRLAAFCASLPAIRSRIEADLAKTGLPREKILATVVRLLEATSIRIGNVEYAKTNHSYGLTTLRNKHVEISGGTVRFRFRGKSGQDHEVKLNDRRLARIIQQCHDLPGYELFQYVDESGEVCRVASDDVNQYLREVSGQDFTAKEFRTWSGTVLMARALDECGSYESETDAKRKVAAAVKTVAQKLGNRPSTCRTYYVHPGIIDTYMQGNLPRMGELVEADKPDTELSAAELCVLEVIVKEQGSKDE